LGLARLANKAKYLLSVVLVTISLTSVIFCFSPSTIAQSSSPNGPVWSTETGSSYWIAASGGKGQLQSGQSADLMLSGIGFNETGGSLLFNHPMEVATDGTHLLLADTRNNRILIWDSLPTGNTPPDLVLGQQNFDSNAPGQGLDQMDWPVAVSAADGKVVVADTYNNRILIWNSFPTRNGQPADLEICGQFPINWVRNTGSAMNLTSLLHTIKWPWGVWTNGTKMVVTDTDMSTSLALIWNAFPTENNQSADLYLFGSNGNASDFASPRTITSDGQHLIIGDHNAGGTFFWNSFPTIDDQPYSYFVPSMNWQSGTFTPDGKLMLLGDSLQIWNSYPQTASAHSDINITYFSGINCGDGSDVAFGDGRVYISEYNWNDIAAYNSIPTSNSQLPDFAIGSSSLDIDSALANYIINNPYPVTNGKSLIVSDGLDDALYVYKNIPDQSDAVPDIVYDLYGACPDQSMIWNNTFACYNANHVLIWDSLPMGQPPDQMFINGQVGSVTLQATGLAMDGKYFYLSDGPDNKIYVWQGIPSDNNPTPKYTLNFPNPGRLYSDGNYLVVMAPSNVTNYDLMYGPQGPLEEVDLYNVSTLSSSSEPINAMTIFPENGAILAQGNLIIPTGYNNVQIWTSITQALEGKPANIILGNPNSNGYASIGQNTFFWPATAAYNGNFLWVGETKFSSRLLRFSGTPIPGSGSFTLSYDGNSYPISVNTKATVSDVAFYPANSTLRVKFTESSPSNPMTVSFPNGLFNSTGLDLSIDGVDQNAQISTNSTSTTVQFADPTGNHEADIFVVSPSTPSPSPSASPTPIPTASPSPSPNPSATPTSTPSFSGTSGTTSPTPSSPNSQTSTASTTKPTASISPAPEVPEFLLVTIVVPLFIAITGVVLSLVLKNKHKLMTRAIV